MKSAICRAGVGVWDASIAMNRFRREGDYWTVEYLGTVFRVRDTKGVQYLAHLLLHPGEHFAALDLVRRVSGDGHDDSSDQAGERARSAVGKRIRAAVEKIHSHHPALGRYLAISVKTGRACIYRPDPMEPVTWVE